jgi:hypothetical protein
MERRALGRLRLPVIAGALLAANAVLAAALAAKALAPRPVVVVPSARGEAELLPGAVPEAAAREFALRYVLHFDNYTPSTIEASQAVLRPMISARAWSGASGALDRRAKVVVEGRMSSQVLPLSLRVEGLRVTVEALRRTFVADKLSRESPARYEVVLEKQPVTVPNPWGLAVVSQSILEAAPGGDRHEER